MSTAVAPTMPSSSPIAAKMKSFWASGTLSGLPRPRPRADHAAVGEAVERLHDLVALVERVGPRVEPDVDAGLHVAEGPPGDVSAGAEHHGAEHEVQQAFGGDPHHHHEEGEEQQRRAEVALADHDDHREAPGEQDRRDVARLGQAERADVPGAGGDQLASFGEVSGEEHGEGELGELTRLEVDRADAHPDAGTADRVAEPRHQGEEQHDRPDEEERPLVTGEVGGALDDEQCGHEGADGDETPECLERGEFVVESGDHDVADAVEQHGEGEQRAVGPAGEDPHGDVRDADECEDGDEEWADTCRDRRVGAERSERRRRQR